MSPRQHTSRKTMMFLSMTCLLLLSTAFTFEKSSAGDAMNTALTSSGDPSATTASTTVLVELFTSEGCSSCPPADKLLSDLEQNQSIESARVIALSEHVDYWNRLGWRDPFSSAQFSQRQSDYARAFGIEDVYTPQMIVDGSVQFVGSKRSAAVDAISKAARSPKANVTIEIKTQATKSVTFAVRVDNVPELSRGDKAEVMLALAENGLHSKVSKGENSGRELAHSGVTRKLLKIGSMDDKVFSGESTINLDSAWKRKDLKAVAFVQGRSGRRVLGAAMVKLAGDF